MGTGYQNGWYTINEDMSCLRHFYHWEREEQREREGGGEREKEGGKEKK